ncbi:Protein of unknown function [Aidingimonas halophila]|uniref:DUF262 domain-containing protein n=2 Tax=Aidingimonas halophila TaxID=574349 RepID=A0A1H2ZP99_9GAMM|nr:Protein of unknown function [Aidingimonas halophila]
MTSHSGNAGFKIPEYQRNYDWSKEKVKRLMEDCLNGFYYLSRSKEDTPFTFLGTIILVTEKSKESSFDGTSLAVVDGQQRLTTLVLICCALIEKIVEVSNDTHELSPKTKSWIDNEVEFHREVLFQCTTGQLQGRGQSFPFPRIVRDGDSRARSHHDSEYRSMISHILWEFAKFYREEIPKFEIPSRSDKAKHERISSNYNYIKEQLSLILYNGDEEAADLESEVFGAGSFKVRAVKEFFEKIGVFSEDSERDRALDEISKSDSVAGLIRLVLFSSYLTQAVVITRVETDDENAAFDIFDALNTTGEPLTALETFKPKVIQYENRASGYNGSVSQQDFERIDGCIDEVFVDPTKKQKETKEVLVSFALFLVGEKLPYDLSLQRNFLRARFDSIPDEESPRLRRRFVDSIADISEFRARYWHSKGIDSLNSFHGERNVDVIKLCCSFIADTGTSLAIPIIARYWTQYNRDGDEDQFVRALKAITAFLLLRRSVTGGTGGIDTELRNIMEKKPNFGGDPLCTGIKHDHKLWGVENLKKELRLSLGKTKLGIVDKESWVNKARYVPLANHSRAICRFLLFSAAHNSRESSSHSGLLTREEVRPSDELDFINYDIWRSEKYATVEHVAPDSDSGSGWDDGIYREPYLRHTIGNLVLLPQKENSSVGNASWPKKKLFYSALVAKTDPELNEALARARKEGFQFKKKTEDLLSNGSRLHMLDAVNKVDEWNEQFIEERNCNTLNRSWEVIGPWLGYDS